jgi:hypothetical protein
MRAWWATQKSTSSNFMKIAKNCAMLRRSMPTRKALIHSIPISEVKNIKAMFIGNQDNFLNNNFELYFLKSILTIFKKEKKEKPH